MVTITNNHTLVLHQQLAINPLTFCVADNQPMNQGPLCVPTANVSTLVPTYLMPTLPPQSCHLQHVIITVLATLPAPLAALPPYAIASNTSPTFVSLLSYIMACSTLNH